MLKQYLYSTATCGGKRSSRIMNRKSWKWLGCRGWILLWESVGDSQADGDSTVDHDEPVHPVDELQNVFDTHEEEEIEDNVDGARPLLLL